MARRKAVTSQFKTRVRIIRGEKRLVKVKKVRGKEKIRMIKPRRSL